MQRLVSSGAGSPLRTVAARAGLLASLAILLIGAGSAVLPGAPVASASPTPHAQPTAAPPQPATPRNETFGIGPSDGKALDSRPYLTFLTGPGQQVTDHVGVVNLTHHALRLHVYPVDAVSSNDGSIAYQPAAAPRREAGSWITVHTPGDGDTVVVAPRKLLVLPITVNVPSNAQPGDHVAGIVASLISKVTGSQSDVNLEQRVALRAMFRVGGDLRPQLSIEGLQVTYHGTLNPIGTGTATVSYRVHNTGNAALGARQQVSVSGLFASEKAKTLPQVPLLLPGASVAERAVVRGVFPTLYMHARVRLYPLVAPGDVDPGLPKSFTAEAGFWAVPWTLLGLVLLVVVAIVTWLVYRRRHPREPSRHRKQKTKQRTPLQAASAAPSADEPVNEGTPA